MAFDSGFEPATNQRPKDDNLAATASALPTELSKEWMHDS